ncbi:MAG: hypothetical protein ACFE7R_10500 [Candidatus Hodarchaeota archaeon]
MGCKAEGAAQGFTLLGVIILIILAFQMLLFGLNVVIGGDLNGVVDTVLAIVLILMAILSVDACGFIHWKVSKNGFLLAVFGFIAIIVVLRNVSFNILGWLMNVGTLAGLMILIAGVLLLTKS